MLDTVTTLKSGRRRSPVSSKKHGERGEKGGGGGAAAASSASALLSTPYGTSSNAHLSPAASNLALPATPSTQSLLSVADERNHSNLQSTNSAPTGILDSSLLPAVPKTAEDQSLDDDPVKQTFIHQRQENGIKKVCAFTVETLVVLWRRFLIFSSCHPFGSSWDSLFLLRLTGFAFKALI